MKTVIITVILLLSFLEVRPQTDLNQIILSGEIKNTKSKQIIIRNNFWDPTDTLQLLNGQFRDTLTLSQGYYYLVHEKAQIRFYLNAGSDIVLNFDLKDVVNTTNWKGIGKNENNYLASKFRLTQNIPFEKRMYSEYAQLNEPAFLAQTDSIYQLYVIHFQNNKNDLDHKFTYLEENSIKIQNALRIAQYQSIKRLVDENPAFKVSEIYPNAFKDIDLNNPDFMQTYSYQDLMTSYFFIGYEC